MLTDEVAEDTEPALRLITAKVALERVVLATKEDKVLSVMMVVANNG